MSVWQVIHKEYPNDSMWKTTILVFQPQTHVIHIYNILSRK